MRPIRRAQGLIVLATLFLPLSASAATYYVAPSGSDAAAGTQAAPWSTFAHAQSIAVAGDTVYFRGGTYAYSSGTTTCSSQTATISAISLDKSGVSGKRISYWAYPGETPIFDFSGIKDSCRIEGFRISASFIHLKGLEIKGVPQNNSLNHESWGIHNTGGSNNIYELLNIHHIMGAGLFFVQGGNNLVLNCDSHENYDPLSSSGAGGNADGFGCHIKAGDTGNVFRGCRAWWNSDDGWDLIEAQEVVTIENSWSWYNGYLPDTTTPSGNGNGFKAGGYGVPAANVPATPPIHVVQQCVAFLNRAAGFYANHHPVADHFYSNTGYMNHPDFDMLGLNGTTAINLGILRNNIAYGGTLLSNETGCDDAYNSWNPAVTITDSDFQSVSIAGMDGPRQADGSLPCLNFLRLQQGSQLIDKGQDVGLAFNNAAPDLGAFEFGSSCTASTGSSSGGSSGSSSGGSSGSSGAASSGSSGAASGGSSSGGSSSSGGGSSGSSGGGGSSSSSGGSSGSSGAGSSGASSSGPSNAGPSGFGTPTRSGGCNCESVGARSESLPGALPSVGVLAWLGWAARRRRVGRRQDGRP